MIKGTVTITHGHIVLYTTIQSCGIEKTPVATKHLGKNGYGVNQAVNQIIMRSIPRIS